MTTPKRSAPTTKRPTTARASPRPRKASSGDTIGTAEPRKIKRVVTRQAQEAAQGAMVAAVQDIVATASDKGLALKTLLQGSSPEDIDEVRKLFRTGANGKSGFKMAADDALASDWRKGGYPYRNLLSRKRYES
jgi:polyphosphate kinase